MIKADVKYVKIEASLDMKCPGSEAITRISAKQLKKVVRRKEPVSLNHLIQMELDGKPVENNQSPNAWE
jgi:hypothetical protein